MNFHLGMKLHHPGSQQSKEQKTAADLSETGRVSPRGQFVFGKEDHFAGTRVDLKWKARRDLMTMCFLKCLSKLRIHHHNPFPVSHRFRREKIHEDRKMRVFPAESLADSSSQKAVPEVDAAVILIVDCSCEPAGRERAAARCGMFAEKCLLPSVRPRKLC
jgi:hypothetical protein